MILVERHEIKGTPEIIRLCALSKELYNKCTFLMRRAWFGGERLPDINILVREAKKLECYKNFHNTKTATQTVRKALTDWSNFKRALNSWKKDPTKFRGMPNSPYYKQKLAQVIFFNETIKGGQTGKKLSTITPTNNLFSIKSNRNYRQVIITPKTFGFIIDVQYDQELPHNKKKGKGNCFIDIGVNNLAAITSDQQMQPILVNGRILKSANRLFNKNPTKKASRKRYFRIENYFHHVSKLIINTCLKYNIGRIIIGKNDWWKQEVRMKKKDRQNFQYIPFCKLFQKIMYKAALSGIIVEFTEEAYTSKASFLDKDPLPEYDKNKESPVFSGKRVKRGLYRSGNTTWNADVNGSLNIGRKVIGEALHGIVNRSLAARPVRVNPLKAFCV